ncbi:response regulator transcription factor [Leucobacter musarum]|uniref:response regulator transcription factor n=1 Tax=Leucobacter musarum TaxID=1930747 RepID=UPI0006A79F6D|nr:response regulator transcription factor [Leucobacter musarum]
MRVLVVEDEEFLAEMIAEGLRAAAIAVDVAHDGLAAKRMLQLGEYDVAVLDRDLPGLRGDDVCRWIIDERLLTRVLMLTAATSIQDRVGGLALGADDYLSKPFAHQELLARVLALGRRVHPAQPPTLRRGDVSVDTVARSAARAGRQLQLSPKEFAVLEALARADGGVVSNEDLIEQVWESGTSYDTNAVRITMSKLRKKLGEPAVIETVPAVGYRMVVDEEPS